MGGIIPGGAYRNRDFYGQWIRFDADVPEDYADIMFDPPQTSGGVVDLGLGGKGPATAGLT